MQDPAFVSDLVGCCVRRIEREREGERKRDGTQTVRVTTVDCELGGSLEKSTGGMSRVNEDAAASEREIRGRRVAISNPHYFTMKL
jgi:hypothetical protein